MSSAHSVHSVDDRCEDVKSENCMINSQDHLENTYIDENIRENGSKNSEKQKSKKSVRISDNESMIISSGVEVLDEVFTPVCHEKPPIKNKTENKVKFCDTRKEISVRARQSSPTTVSEVIIVSSPPLGIWPLKRSASLESRDNPFLPGGELDLETEELLKRATIVRDRFSLDENRLKESDNLINLDQQDGSPQKEKTVVEETISPQSANTSHTTPNNKPKQNGKLEDSSVSPDSVKPEIPNDTVDGAAVSDDAQKDKKKQKKCCIIM